MSPDPISVLDCRQVARASLYRAVFVWANAEFPASRGTQEQAVCHLRFLAGICSDLLILFHPKYEASVDLPAFERSLAEANAEIRLELLPLPLTGRNQLLIAYLFSLAMLPGWALGSYWRHVLAKLTELDPEFTHLEGFSLLPLTRFFPSSRTVLCPRDAYSLKFHRFAAISPDLIRKAGNVARYVFARMLERTFLHRARLVHVVSSVDRRYYDELYEHVAVRQIPIRARARSSNHSIPPAPDPAEPVVLLYGDAREAAILAGLQEFFEQVEPRLESRVAIKVLGRKPDLADHFSVRSPRVTFLEYVDDLERELAGATCAVLCDKAGTGLKNRLLDVLISGVPAIATPAAIEGFEAAGPRPFIVASSADEMAETINRICYDGALRARLVSAIPGFLRPYTAAAVDHRWTELYAELTGRERGRIVAGTSGAAEPRERPDECQTGLTEGGQHDASDQPRQTPARSERGR